MQDARTRRVSLAEHDISAMQCLRLARGLCQFLRMRHPESVIGNWGLGNGGHMTPGEVRGALLIVFVVIGSMIVGIWAGWSQSSL